MVLFRFIQEKDVFEKYYKQHLAKRLLLGSSVSDDAEKGMISKLKTECGYQFTAKLEGMFTDMRTSATTMENFKNFIAGHEKNPLKGIDINVNVLTTGFWPTQAAATCTLPIEVQGCTQVFEKFYLNSHSGRRLTFQTNMGTGELRAYFGTKRHELNVSTFQMCILLLFNKHDTLSFKDIQEETNIPIQDLKRNLYTLSCAKYKILVKNPANAKFGPTDTFSFNSEFKSKLFRVKVNPVPMGNTEKDRESMNEKIAEDRKHLIEAAIVRVMKARNRLQHNNLVSEVIQQLNSRFNPPVPVIKKRIESLIEREYLEREKADRRVYVYLA